MICAWVVTSSPVVGSSRTTSSGSHASAIAITTRCCCPPESWCGYLAAVRAGEGSRICAMSSTARRSRSRREPPTPWTAIVSTSCAPTRIPGESAVAGFCGTRLARRPRSFCSSRRERRARSRPAKRIVPARTRLPGRWKPRRASAVVVLPQPDSPTRPSASPRRSENVTPLTTFAQLSFDQKSIVSPLTSTSGAAARAASGCVVATALTVSSSPSARARGPRRRSRG
jgi:hypothetical protein